LFDLKQLGVLPKSNISLTLVADRPVSIADSKHFVDDVTGAYPKPNDKQEPLDDEKMLFFIPVLHRQGSSIEHAASPVILLRNVAPLDVSKQPDGFGAVVSTIFLQMQLEPDEMVWSMLLQMELPH
jgi:hypothetical protein